MTALSIQPPFPIFTDSDGSPLENGYIWLGQINLNPVSNPISAYWDANLTQLAGQPIRTLNGYPSNNGTPGRLYVNSDYSISVLNKNGSLVYGSPSAKDRFNYFISTPSVSNATGNGVQILFPLIAPPSFIHINGVYQNRNTYSYANGGVLFSQAPPLNAKIEFIL